MRLLLLALLFTSCSYRSLSVERERVDRSTLASTFVGSPDPAQKNPPKGETLWINWQIPQSEFQKGMTLALRVIYNNFQEERIIYPIHRRAGGVSYPLLGKKYKQVGGFLTYRADLFDAEGNVSESWVQQMWYNPI